jgi:hypothetical protein
MDIPRGKLEMKRLLALVPAALTLAAVAALAAPAGGHEYLLVPVSHAAAAIRPAAAGLSTTDCGTQVDFADANPFALPPQSQHYAGTAYPAMIRVKGGAPVAGYVMQHGLKDGAVLANLKVAEEGQTCAEMIRGNPVIFKKYSATPQ